MADKGNVGAKVALKLLDDPSKLLSTVQMPSGVPVATVAIGNGLNAGLLAAQILATADPRLAQAISDYRDGLHGQVRAKDARLQQLGAAHQALAAAGAGSAAALEGGAVAAAATPPTDLVERQEGEAAGAAALEQVDGAGGDAVVVNYHLA